MEKKSCIVSFTIQLVFFSIVRLYAFYSFKAYKYPRFVNRFPHLSSLISSSSQLGERFGKHFLAILSCDNNLCEIVVDVLRLCYLVQIKWAVLKQLVYLLPVENVFNINSHSFLAGNVHQCSLLKNVRTTITGSDKNKT